MPKVSVIIPVYNTEKYLRKCLDSVCNQTLSDIEIICVNDCSPDNSLEILKEYAKKDNRIKIINFEENKGAAVARNTGIDEAKGEYLGFVDSDDYPDIDFYEKLYNKAVETGADCAKGIYKYFHENFVEFSINQKIKENKLNFMCEYCSAIFRTSIIHLNNLYFPNLIEMEDPYFAFSFALIANHIEVLSDAIINIVTHSDSQTASIPSLERIRNKLTGLEMMITLANTSNIEKDVYGYIFALWFNTISKSSLQNKSIEIRKYFAKQIIMLSRKLKYVSNFRFQLQKTDVKLLKYLESNDMDALVILNETTQIGTFLNQNKEYYRTIETMNKQKRIFIKKYVLPQLKKSNGERVLIISVVNDYELYKHCIAENPYITYPQNIEHINFDNTKDNIFIAKRYNTFLNNYNYEKDAWFVFCHCDWELQEDINPILEKLDKNCFYGPVGAICRFLNGKVFREITGSCYERRRDGSGYRYIGTDKNKEISDTFDCQAFIVHSSLVKKYNLRFDEKLQWDLYVEDICINSKQKYDINSYTIKLDCCHWSGYHITPTSYYESLNYINNKYPNNLYAGTVSFIGNKKYVEASSKDIVFYKLRKGIK
mgnify:CR=1 FL=1